MKVIFLTATIIASASICHASPLRANPVEQTVSFTPVKARYFKLIAKHALELNHAAVAELGVVEAK